MKTIFFYIKNIENIIKKYNFQYENILLSNIEIKNMIKKYNNNNENIFFNEIQSKYILIKLENYNEIIEFKTILEKYYKIIILNDEKVFMSTNEVMKYCSKIKNEIISEKIENISEKKSIFEKLFKMKIDNVFCITYRNSDYKNKILSQMNRMNSSVEFLNLNDEKLFNDSKNIINIYKKCILNAKKKKYSNILILTEENEFNYSNFYKFLSNNNNLIDDFDILFLSGKLLDGNIYDDNLLNVKKIEDVCSLIINEKIYDNILNELDEKYKNIENFFTKKICIREKSYFVNPLISYKSDKIIDNRVITYRDVMNKLCILNSLKYVKNFDVFIISRNTNPNEIELMQNNKIFSNFNIFKKIINYDFEKDIKTLENFNLYNFKGIRSHDYDKNKMKNIMNNYILWEYFSKQKDNKLNLILYDDVNFTRNIKYRLNNYLKNIPDDIDILLLNSNKKIQGDKYKNLLKIVNYDDFKCHRGYFITNNCCKKIMKYIENNKIQDDIDTFLINLYNKINIYKTNENIINYEYNEENKELLDIYYVNKKINKNKKKKENLHNEIIKHINSKKMEEEYKDNIVNDSIDENLKFKEYISDNDYKEILINNDVFFKNSKGLLFRLLNDMFSYYGYIKDNKIIVNSLSKSAFGFSLKTSEKESVIFYNENDKIPYFMKKIYELNSLKYNVFVIGTNYYNIKVNNVYYLSSKDNELLEKLIKINNIKKIYTTTPLILLKYIKRKDIELNYICDRSKISLELDKIKLKNNGVEFMINSFDKFDNIYFFSKHIMEEFKDELNLNEYPKNFKLNSYALPKNKIKNKLGTKENIIVSYDKHPEKVLNSFKLINKKMQNKFTLVLLTNNYRIDQENVKIEKFSQENLIKYFSKSYFFLTFENNVDTYYNIINAINHYCIPICSNYFYEFKNKFICFNNFINKHVLDNIKEIFTNDKKKIIYNNICDKIIKNHLDNMIY